MIVAELFLDEGARWRRQKVLRGVLVALFQVSVGLVASGAFGEERGGQALVEAARHIFPDAQSERLIPEAKPGEPMMISEVMGPFEVVKRRLREVVRANEALPGGLRASSIEEGKGAGRGGAFLELLLQGPTGERAGVIRVYEVGRWCRVEVVGFGGGEGGGPLPPLPVKLEEKMWLVPLEGE